MLLFQDHHFKFRTSLFLSLCLLVSPLWKGLSLPFILLFFNFYVKTPPLVKKNLIRTSHDLNGREKNGGEIVFHTILYYAVNAIVDSALKGWMEQPYLHLPFISTNIGRKNC